jgi:hypothetical protein
MELLLTWLFLVSRVCLEPQARKFNGSLRHMRFSCLRFSLSEAPLVIGLD